MVGPGELITAVSKSHTSGKGTYVLDGKIYASVCGNVSMENTTVVVDLPNKTSVSDMIIHVGDEVIGQVTKIKMKQAFVDIFAIKGTVLNEKQIGIIRTEDVRDKDIDAVVIEQHFVPNQVVRAVVRSVGDSRSYYLSTAHPNCGVVECKSI